jgi:hypothetical protein
MNVSFGYFSVFVFNPRGTYNGHMPNSPVSKNIPAKTNKTIDSVPVIRCAKYNTPIMTATRILITLSIVPMFFFIITLFLI